MAEGFNVNCDRDSRKLMKKNSRIFGIVNHLLWLRTYEPPVKQNWAGVQHNNSDTPDSDKEAVTAENSSKSANSNQQTDKSCQEHDDNFSVADSDDKGKCFDPDAFTCPKHIQGSETKTEVVDDFIRDDLLHVTEESRTREGRWVAKFYENDDQAEKNYPVGDSDYFTNDKNSSSKATDSGTTSTVNALTAKVSKKAKKGKKRKRIVFGHIFRRRSCVIFLSIFEFFLRISQIFEEICKIPRKAHENLKKLTLKFRKLPDKLSVLLDTKPSGTQRAPVDQISLLFKNRCYLKASGGISTENQITTKESSEISLEPGNFFIRKKKKYKNDTAETQKSINEKGEIPVMLAGVSVQNRKQDQCDAPNESNDGERKFSEDQIWSDKTKIDAEGQGKLPSELARNLLKIGKQNHITISDPEDDKGKFSSRQNQSDKTGKNINERKISSAEVIFIDSTEKNIENRKISRDTYSENIKSAINEEENRFSTVQFQTDTTEKGNENEKKQRQDHVKSDTRGQEKSLKEHFQSDTAQKKGNEKEETFEEKKQNSDKNSVSDVIPYRFKEVYPLTGKTKGSKSFISLKSDVTYSFTLRAFDTAGEVEVKLFQPRPATNFKDEQARLSSFTGLRSRHSAGFLAQSGFYASDNGFIQCCSCSVRHKIDEISIGSTGSNLVHHGHCQFEKKIRFPTQELINDVEPDGIPSDHSGDPPGQQSTYIPPGDVRREQYRLSTFEQFRIVDPSFRKGLAKNGFYFTGFYDRVKCFSCARSVEKWEPRNDNPADKKWHKPNCSFFNKNPNSGNIPIRSLLGNLNFRQSTSSQDEVLQQRDNTGQVVRTVRYPADLPERVRRSGGTFEIGPNNSIQIRSGNQQNFTIGGNRDQRQPTAPASVPSYTPSWRMANVASSDHKRFLTNLYLRREIDRLTSFARWPTDRPNVPPSALAKSGFFYLGDMDRVQCFSCGGVLRNWTLEDSADEQHRVHFGGCRMVLRTETRNIPVPEVDESSQLLATNYPLRFPSNPHMRGQAQREATFDRRWPTGRLNVTTVEIAAAGFFYLGERDRVKCFYCNGGLQNWEIDDKPWDEHAKWFPNCQFLLRSKGQRFVHYHLSRNAELARPIIGRQDGSPLDPMGVPQVGSRGHDVPPRETRPPTPPPTIIDPQEEMRKRKERVKTIMQNSEVVKNVLAMGFGENIVEPLLEDRIIANNIANPNDIYGSVSELLDDVMKKEEEIRQEEEQRRNQTTSLLSNPSEYSPMSSLSTLGSLVPGSGKYNVSYFDDEEMNDIDMYGGSMEGASGQEETPAKQVASMEGDTESLQKQLDKIEEERMCKICFSNVADMLFSPCSHMVCCMECTQAIKHCPVCRKRIEKALKTYLK